MHHGSKSAVAGAEQATATRPGPGEVKVEAIIDGVAQGVTLDVRRSTYTTPRMGLTLSIASLSAICARRLLAERTRPGQSVRGRDCRHDCVAPSDIVPRTRRSGTRESGIMGRVFRGQSCVSDLGP